VSTAIIGLSLWGLGALGASTSLSLAEALTFGALISATDPVSTLAVFESLVRIFSTAVFIYFKRRYD
jgi:NhaP-type Na+/H+ or K+/H+ antiporter|tara:strand:- start:443 stop:643 length:201 start_codon:yes stop_codon:yes gene_type:complete